MKNIVLLAADPKGIENQPAVEHLPIVLHPAARCGVKYRGQKTFDGHPTFLSTPVPWKVRHLETFNGVPLITRLIEKCTIENTRLYITIHPKNHLLINHIKSCHPTVKIIYPPAETMLSTFEAVLGIDGDCIMVDGDLVGVRDGDIKKFVDSPYSSALCRGPFLEGGLWENHWKSFKGNIRRIDLGTYVTMIGEAHKEEFLSGYAHLDSYFEEFGGFGGIYTGRPDEGAPVKMNSHTFDDKKNWHIIGCMSYTFFKRIFSDPNLNSDGEKGTVYFSHFIGEDND
tara:strand:- start:1882 stop:2733 length:852 start_codon:yes stop_codon:yes gene_type:complete